MIKLGVTVLGVWLLASSAWAAGPDTALDGAGRKLNRGIVNVGTGWLEVPKQIVEEGRGGKGFWRVWHVFRGLTLGTLKGVAWTAAREVSGVWDVVTFGVPVPKDYEPWFLPEYPFDFDEIDTEPGEASIK